MSSKSDDHRSRLLELCDELAEHLKLLRDYGNTPGNIWLAKGELSKINQISAEIDTVLQAIKDAEG